MKKVTTKKSPTSKKMSPLAKGVAVSVGIAAVGTAAYLLLGPDGKKNQKKVLNAVDHAKKEIKKLENSVPKGVKKATQKMMAQKKKIVKKVTQKITNTQKKIAKLPVKKSVQKIAKRIEKKNFKK